ncbi:hypothetical protein [Clostridium scatologenes]|uniref:Uncharacterized protein n=1 Tax=Clostridium scatologenes TaxID=1548 RepID=A0A0E3MBR4_CLOSL|nr:hypothetical protein [Clostridium scatologenes]AKA72044.1 hypothetical protein CSCA_4919 [Clostridium scatologenes]
MTLLNRIYDNLRNLGVFKKEDLTIRMGTLTKEDGTIEYYINLPKDGDDNSKLKEDYLYINHIEIQDYGVKDNSSFGDYLEKNINSSNISLNVGVDNDLRYYSPKILFKGSYDGTYYDTEILDHWLVIAEITVEGIDKYNCIFEEHKNTLGKLLDCVSYLEKDDIPHAFDSAYTALEMLIKEVEHKSSLTPIETKEYLIQNGIKESKAEKIRRLRNEDRIHPDEYGFFYQNPDLEEKLEKALKHIIKAYFNIFSEI